jgi:hypothetical protein
MRNVISKFCKALLGGKNMNNSLRIVIASPPPHPQENALISSLNNGRLWTGGLICCRNSRDMKVHQNLQTGSFHDHVLSHVYYIYEQLKLKMSCTKMRCVR